MGCCGEPVEDDAPPRYNDRPTGPTKDRGCTDILCLGLFVAFLVGWGVVAVFAFVHGNPEQLINPTDSQGNICGIGQYKAQKYLFFFDLTKCATASILLTGCPTTQICVESCPNSTFAAFNAPGLHSQKSQLKCTYDVDMSRYNDDAAVNSLIQTGKCAPYYLDSSPGSDSIDVEPRDFGLGTSVPKIKNPMIGRCLPKVINDLGSTIMDSFKRPITTADGRTVTNESLSEADKFLKELNNLRHTGELIFVDFKTCWWMMLLGVVFAMVLSFIWIVLIRFLGGFMVWLSLLLMLALFGAGCGFSFYKYKELEGVPGSDEKIQFSTNFNYYLQLRQTWLAFGIIAAIFLAIILLIILFLRKRLCIAIALINESSKAVAHIMSSLFFPLFPFVLQVGVFSFWGAVAVYLASSGKPTYRSFITNAAVSNCSSYKNQTECDQSTFNPLCGDCIFFKYDGDSLLYAAQFYNLFALLWSMFFVDGLSQMILAGAFASWYWAFVKPKDVPMLPITSSFGRTFRYHLGSIAFGSLIIAIVRMIRIILEYLDRKLKEYADNGCVKCIMCCLKCFFWCLEKFLKFINKNAYIMVAIYGKNFCSSARNAFSLIIRNVLRTVVVDKVTDFLLFIGKLFVVGGLGAFSFCFFSGQIPGLNKYVPPLNYYFIPVIVIVVGSYMVSAAFFGVYEMAVDTIFLCFLEDCERNDGTPQKPYFMSKRLMQILGKKNKKEKIQ